MTIEEYKSQLEQTKMLKGVERSHYALLHQYLKDFYASLNLSPMFIIEGSVQSTMEEASSKMFPDFQVLNKEANALIGLIEAKDFGYDISKLIKGKDAQVKKYLEHQPNLIVTNFERFVLLTLSEKQVVVLEDYSIFSQTQQVHQLLERFINAEPNPELGAFEIYVKVIAAYAHTLERLLAKVIKKELKNEESPFYKFFQGMIKETLQLTNQKESEFARSMIESYVFYQIFNHQLGVQIDILEEMIVSFLTDGIKFVGDDKLDVAFVQLKNAILRADKDKFKQWVYQYESSEAEQSLFTYFYEHFLTMFNPELKKELGVFYTPRPAVIFIVDAINSLLQKEFGFADKPDLGLGSSSVKLLDFATGTGTFLLEALEQTFKLLGSRTDKQKQEDITSMLARFYGFEVMTTPWVLAKYNLQEKVNELLGNSDFNINDSKIYLTNTLEHNGLAKPLSYSKIEKFSENIVYSNQIKAAKDIFVILGNPPYNKDSQNKQEKKSKSTHNDNTFIQIEKLLQDYKPKGETNIKTLSDDYIKFIRWAHHKIAENGKGIIGIITPHSFLSGATYRAMRNKMMEDFDQIYIINLHGNSNTQRHADDVNVFNIKTGVAITLLVKTSQNTSKEQCKVHYHELIGKRQAKFDYLEQGFSAAHWQQLNPLAFDAYLDSLRWGKSYNNLRFFVPTQKKQQEIVAYGDFWGVGEIFNKFSTGIGTYFDEFAISFTQAEAEEKIDELINLRQHEFEQKYEKLDGTDWKHAKSCQEVEQFLKEKPYKLIFYRPFDTRVIWYSGKQGIVARPRFNIMQHVSVPNNIFLIFTRFTNKEYYRHIHVSSLMSDNHSISDKAYTAPLYLLPAQPKPSKKAKKESLDLHIPQDTQPQLNFTPAFLAFYQELQAKWSSSVVSPETVFAYIYALLSTPAYQDKYNDLLSLDYPRVFFTEDQALFSKMAELGQKLINCHTMDNSALARHSRSDAISMQVLHLQAELDAIDGQTTYVKMETAAILFHNKQRLTLPESLTGYTIGSYEVIKTFINNRKEILPFQQYKEEFWQVIVAVDLALCIEQQLDDLLLQLLLD